DPVHDAVNALQKFPDAAQSRLFFHCLRALIELAEVGPGAETRLLLAVDDQRMRIAFQIVQSGSEVFEIVERGRADLVARLTVESQLDDAVVLLPRDRFRLMHRNTHHQGHEVSRRKTSTLTLLVSLGTNLQCHSSVWPQRRRASACRSPSAARSRW